MILPLLHGPLLVAVAVAAAACAWWGTPWILDLGGLADFAFVGRFAIVIVALSALEAVLQRRFGHAA
jgi:hypothetical protein